MHSGRPKGIPACYYKENLMSNLTTYLSEILSALQSLGGMGSLKEINDLIERRNLLPYIHTNVNWRGNVRAVIQRHCSETQSYHGGGDIFYSVYGLGEGFWGILSMKDSLEEMPVDPITERQLDEVENDSAISPTERNMIVRARIGQGIFRERIIQKYHKCIVTGIDDARLLIASHIKPWRSSDNSERLSSENGLLLSPLYDKLFDSGLITFDDSFNMIISEDISEHNRAKIVSQRSSGQHYAMSTELKRNLEYHRDIIFRR